MIVIHEPMNTRHDYLFLLWFAAMTAYAAAHGLAIGRTEDLAEPRNATVLADTEYLSPATIDTLKNNGCKIVGFNLVDSSYIAEPCRGCMGDIDLIFSFTGIQTTNTGHELEFDDQFQPQLVEREFLQPDQWQVFDAMRRSGRLLSLPYVHWDKQPGADHIPASQKNGKVMVRGGAHFRRVVLAYFLLRAGLLDPNSGFPLNDYFQPEMAEQFRFCEDCQVRFVQGGRKYHWHVAEHHDACTSPAQWGKALDLSRPGEWNNRCTRAWYWLAEKFGKQHGRLDESALQQLFNTPYGTSEQHFEMLRQASFTADLKWLHSIYAAQRFWDGAICGTVNMLPERTNDQEYFPIIRTGENFITFREDMSDLGSVQLEPDAYSHIQAETLAIYAEWIKPTDYSVNTNMLRHIFERIDAI